MRTGICITLKPGDRRRLAALARDRTPHISMWRAEIVLLSAGGVGTHEIMRRTGKSKTSSFGEAAATLCREHGFLHYLAITTAQLPGLSLI